MLPSSGLSAPCHRSYSSRNVGHHSVHSRVASVGQLAATVAHTCATASLDGVGCTVPSDRETERQRAQRRGRATLQIYILPQERRATTVPSTGGEVRVLNFPRHPGETGVRSLDSAETPDTPARTPESRTPECAVRRRKGSEQDPTFAIAWTGLVSLDRRLGLGCFASTVAVRVNTQTHEICEQAVRHQLPVSLRAATHSRSQGASRARQTDGARLQ